jgi:2-polyprenyl-3-methyl-5-hydroxy-6-metoxy-1,4-benzoquinol methylase
MDQTPAHENHNPDLLLLMPATARRVVEVGCSSGALAREYKRRNPGCHYMGIELVPAYAELARRHCDEVVDLDVETVSDQTLAGLETDCWVFGDVLEHLRDPWALLRKIRKVIPADGHVVACIPNAQHWSVQARLSCGELRYEDMGLLDRSHLRWFTRITMLEMFQQAGFKVAAGRSRVFDEPQREKIMPAIKAMAEALGANVQQALTDAAAFQYVMDAIPA